MRDSGDPLLFTRRGVLVLAGGLGATLWSPLYAGSHEFWEKKPPSEWTSDEIDRLITKSPWAKEVTAEGGPAHGGGMGGPGGGGGRGGGVHLPGGIPFPGGGGIGGGMGGGRRGGGGRGGPGRAAQMKGTVRWESAKPILEALKTKLPDSMADRYVIGVSGFPLDRRSRNEESDSSSGPSEEMIERLKSVTFLRPKGKAEAQPGVVESQVTTGTTSLLFGFAKDLIRLDRDDTEVTFSTQLGRASVKTKFSLKEMLYRKELAV